MKKFTVLAVLGIAPGTVLGLTKAQAAPRMHALKQVGKDAYEVKSRIEFKVGEVIATDAELNKALASQLETEETTRSKAKSKDKDEHDAKALAELKDKGKRWDEIQGELEGLRTATALFNGLPDAVRADAVARAEAALKPRQ